MKQPRPKENEMPLRRARVGRVGVIGHPVAKTAVVAKAVTPGAAPVARTAVVAAAVPPGRGLRRRIWLCRLPGRLEGGVLELIGVPPSAGPAMRPLQRRRDGF